MNIKTAGMANHSMFKPPIKSNNGHNSKAGRINCNTAAHARIGFG